MAFNLGNLGRDPFQDREYYSGEVVSVDDPDNLGRIKVRITPLFDAAWSLDQLPLINMAPSAGMYIQPSIGTFVVIDFRGTIYEGFYVANFVNKVDADKFDDSNLNDSFNLISRGTTIHGKYDGSFLEIKTPNFSIKDENGVVELTATTDITINSTGTVNIKHAAGALTVDGTFVVPKTSGPLNSIIVCPLTGQPHSGNVCSP